MRRALVRGLWALPVAAGLTQVILPAAAQPPAPAVAPARPAAERATRLAEINVALAWLADPLTFPCELAARVRGGAMEIRGFVPSEAARARAAQAARQACKLPVVDALTLQPAPVRHVTVPVEQLRTGVEVILHREFPAQAAALRILCGASGQVILSGRAGSAEEKLAMSVALRRLPGCTSVVNELTAPGEVVAPRAAAGPSLPPAPMPAPAPAAVPTGSPFAPTPTAAAALPEPAPAVRTPPQMTEGPAAPPAPTAPPARPARANVAGPSIYARTTWSSLPATPAARPPSPKGEGIPEAPADAWKTAAPGAASPSPYGAWETPVPPRASAPVQTVGPPPAAPVPAPAAVNRPQTFTTARPAAAPSPLPVLERVAERPNDGSRLNPVPAAPAPSPARAAAASVVQTSYRPEGVPLSEVASPYQGGASASASPYQAITTTPAPLPLPPSVPAVPPAPVPAVRTVTLPTPPPAPPLPVPAAPAKPPMPVLPVPPPVGKTVAPVAATAAPVVRTAAVTPTPVTPPARPDAAASRPGEPYVTTGLLILPEPQKPAAEPSSPWARRQEFLRQAVQATCGPRASDVAVEIQSPTQALVRFRAPTKADADRLWMAIQRMPELAPYELRAVIKAADTAH